MNDRIRHRREAEIISSRELSAVGRSRPLERKIAETNFPGKLIQPHYTVDEKILGGVIVEIGSTIYDGSGHGELRRLNIGTTAMD